MSMRFILAGAQMPAHISQHRGDRATSARRIIHYLAGCWSRFIVWQLRRTIHLFLVSLDDHTLQALGLRRSDIDATVAAIDWRAVRWRIDV